MAEIDEDVYLLCQKIHLRFLEGEISDVECVSEYARALMEAKREERERCARIADELQYSADAAFNERVTRSRKGEKNLELAASAAAGMSHQARKAAAAIRKEASHDQA